MRKYSGNCFRKNLVYEQKVPNCKWFFTGGLKREKYNLVVDTE